MSYKALLLRPDSSVVRCSIFTDEKELVKIKYQEKFLVIQREKELNLADITVDESRGLTRNEKESIMKTFKDVDALKVSLGIGLIDKKSGKSIGLLATDSDFDWIMISELVSKNRS